LIVNSKHQKLKKLNTKTVINFAICLQTSLALIEVASFFCFSQKKIKRKAGNSFLLFLIFKLLVLN